MDRDAHRIARTEEAVQAVRVAHRRAPRALRRQRQGAAAVPDVLRGGHRRRNARDDDGRPCRALGTGRGGRHAGAGDRRGRPGGVRRDVRPGLQRQEVDRQGTRPADQGDRGRGARRGEMSAGVAIRVKNLEKSFNELHVLRGVDFDVARGSIFALLGSNGAGKTTVVRILSTLSRADGGTAGVNGFDVAAQPQDVRESISLTGQFAAVDEILTGRENLVLVAQLRHLPDPGRIADDMLARFSLTEAGGRKAATYSGGMRRRLDIAMSLIGDPPVIFLDEPTTGLDPQARIEVWRTVKELATSGTTVLLTTQYLVEAEQLADRIAILHHGRIIVNGTLAELKQLLPPAKVEYIEKQPTLEEVFLAIVADDGKDGDPAMTAASARTSE